MTQEEYEAQEPMRQELRKKCEEDWIVPLIIWGAVFYGFLRAIASWLG